MNTIDIIVGVALIVAIISGWRDGFVRQVLGLAGLVAAVWLAVHYGDMVGKWLHIDASVASAAGFLAVFVVVGIAAAMASWSISKLFHFAGFGIPDRLLGAVVGVVKMTLLLSGVFWAINHLDKGNDLLSSQTIEQSRTYQPISKVAEKLFPTLQWLGDKIPTHESHE